MPRKSSRRQAANEAAEQLSEIPSWQSSQSSASSKAGSSKRGSALKMSRRTSLRKPPLVDFITGQLQRTPSAAELIKPLVRSLTSGHVRAPDGTDPPIPADGTDPPTGTIEHAEQFHCERANNQSLSHVPSSVYSMGQLGRTPPSAAERIKGNSPAYQPPMEDTESRTHSEQVRDVYANTYGIKTRQSTVAARKCPTARQNASRADYSAQKCSTTPADVQNAELEEVVQITTTTNGSRSGSDTISKVQTRRIIDSWGASDGPTPLTMSQDHLRVAAELAHLRFTRFNRTAEVHTGNLPWVDHRLSKPTKEFMKKRMFDGFERMRSARPKAFFLTSAAFANDLDRTIQDEFGIAAPRNPQVTAQLNSRNTAQHHEIPHSWTSICGAGYRTDTGPAVCRHFAKHDRCRVDCVHERLCARNNSKFGRCRVTDKLDLRHIETMSIDGDTSKTNKLDQLLEDDLENVAAATNGMTDRDDWDSLGVPLHNSNEMVDRDDWDSLGVPLHIPLDEAACGESADGQFEILTWNLEHHGFTANTDQGGKPFASKQLANRHNHGYEETGAQLHQRIDNVIQAIPESVGLIGLNEIGHLAYEQLRKHFVDRRQFETIVGVSDIDQHPGMDHLLSNIDEISFVSPGEIPDYQNFYGNVCFVDTLKWDIIHKACVLYPNTDDVYRSNTLMIAHLVHKDSHQELVWLHTHLKFPPVAHSSEKGFQIKTIQKWLEFYSGRRVLVTGDLYLQHDTELLLKSHITLDTSKCTTTAAKSVQAEHAIWEVFLGERQGWLPFDQQITTLLEQGYQTGETELNGLMIRGQSYTIQCGRPNNAPTSPPGAAAPAGGGMFGGAAAPAGGGMFGGAAAPAGAGMFGGAAAQPAAAGGGLFGNALTQRNEEYGTERPVRRQIADKGNTPRNTEQILELINYKRTHRQSGNADQILHSTERFMRCNPTMDRFNLMPLGELELLPRANDIQSKTEIADGASFLADWQQHSEGDDDCAELQLNFSDHMGVMGTYVLGSSEKSLEDTNQLFDA